MAQTISASEQAVHNELDTEDRHCVNMGGRCTRRASVDVTVEMSGRSLALRLCTHHAGDIQLKGLRNATVVATKAI